VCFSSDEAIPVGVAFVVLFFYLFCLSNEGSIMMTYVLYYFFVDTDRILSLLYIYIYILLHLVIT
jgi:hypothetical protein